MIHAFKDMIIDIQNPLKECSDLENIDTRIETIFSEMNAIVIDGKIKKHG
jgi:hypothetical protein